MKYAILNTNEHNGTKVGVNIFYASPMLSGQHIGKFATSENALNEFPDILADLDYTIAELDPSAFEIDLTPPTPTGLRIAIPADWEIFFPEDRFIVGPFDIALERIEGVLAVDIAYLGWEAFREELLKPEHASLARHMGTVMRYLEIQKIKENYI